MKKRLWLTGLSLAAFAAGCGDDAPEEESADVEGCEHLVEGPAVAVTATEDGAAAPAVSDDHQRYDIALPAATEGSGQAGTVRFASSEASDYVFFTSVDLPFSVRTSGGELVALEDRQTSSSECSEVKGRYVAELGVGTYLLSFGPSAASAVSLVIEPATDPSH